MRARARRLYAIRKSITYICALIQQPSPIDPMQYAVLREQATELPFSGEVQHEGTPHGIYTCAGLSAIRLFESDANSIPGAAAEFDYPAPRGGEYSMRRRDGSATALSGPRLCSKCNGHLARVRGLPGPTGCCVTHQLGGR